MPDVTRTRRAVGRSATSPGLTEPQLHGRPPSPSPSPPAAPADGGAPRIARTPGRFGPLRVQQLVLLEVAAALVAGAWVLAPKALIPAVVVAVLLLPWLYVKQHRSLAAQLAQLRSLGRRRRSAATVALAVAARAAQSAQSGGAGRAASEDTQFVPVLECDPALRTLTYRDRDDRGVGLVGDGSFLTAVLAVRSPDSPLRPTRDRQSLDLALLHRALRTDDVVLESVQLLQHTQPAPAPHLPPHSAAHRSYAELTGEGAAGAAPPALRLSWIALKLDPELCPEAVLARGGGLLGAQRCVVMAADHLARAVQQLGFAVDLLDEARIVSALGATMCVNPRASGGPAGAATGRRRTAETATDWRCDDRWHSVFWVSQWPALGPGAMPELARRLTSLPALASALSITVTAGAGGGAELSSYLRLVARSAAELAQLRRQLTALARHSRTPLVLLDREQVPGVLATLPLGGTR